MLRSLIKFTLIIMALSLQESFDRSCRLCAEEQEVTILLFGKEAEAMLLQSKLNKYLLIEIEEDDKLPKNVCLGCCSKLNSVCDFIEQARKAQDTLLSRSYMLDKATPNLQIQSVQSLATVKQELISYNDNESHDESQVTEMEINVDPMMILQNSESMSSPCNEDQNPEEDDISHLHGLSGENVTLKRIRISDMAADENDEGEIKLSDDKKSDGNKPFSCNVCKRSYLTELALKNHFWNHTPDVNRESKPFKCSNCFEAFDFRVDLNDHMKSHRTMTTCKVCKRVFRSAENLQLHMESHKSSSAHVCKICGRSYNNKSNLKNHSVTHSDERPFKCHLCRKSFKRNQDLKFHINQHTGAKPYRCPFCDKCFASSGNCYSHRNRMHPGRHLETKRTGRRINKQATIQKVVVTPDKPVFRFQCQLCQHSFLKRDNYLYHMFQHTGEKPFQCAYCPDESFVTRKGLFLHHSKAHANSDKPLSIVSKNQLLQ